jgi:hypothetical protein
MNIKMGFLRVVRNLLQRLQRLIVGPARVTRKDMFVTSALRFHAFDTNRETLENMEIVRACYRDGSFTGKSQLPTKG